MNVSHQLGVVLPPLKLGQAKRSKEKRENGGQCKHLLAVTEG
jgi:hypothetical protein